MKHTLYIAWKDLKTEFRTKQMLNSMIIFSMLVIIVFSFSFGDVLGDQKLITQIAPGILWISFIFAGMLGLSRSFAGEKEEGCLEGLKLCPVERTTLFSGKVIANTVLMFIIEAITIPLFIVLFNYSLSGLGNLAVIILLGTLGFMFVGTLLSALTVNMRTREMLLPVIVFPVLLPVLISSVVATSKILTGEGLSDITGEIQILAVYDVIFYIVAQLVFEYVIED
jgi:heme exporter protein B